MMVEEEGVGVGVHCSLKGEVAVVVHLIECWVVDLLAELAGDLFCLYLGVEEEEEVRIYRRLAWVVKEGQ
jgi:hypothetical protein